MTASPLTPGSGPFRFGPYLVLDELGRGAMGAVYRARDERAGREVALKVLLPDADLNSLIRLQREGVLTAALNHPGIVAIHDAGEIEGVPYLVYELVTGARTLEEVLPQVSREERLDLVRQVAQAVGHAHAAGVVHRDLKPSNVLVTAEGRAKVADFGLASHENAERLTQTNAIVGTPLFMSPEQIAAARDLIGPPADVWALGVLLYYALTLEFPFEGVSLIELAGQIMNETPQPLREHDPSIPRLYEGVLAGALERHVEDRFPDGATFAAAMEGKLPQQASQRPLFAALGLLALLALGLALTLGIKLRAPRLVTPTPSATLLADALDEALRAERWDEVEVALEGHPAASAWRVRLALARDGAESAAQALEVAEGLGDSHRVLLVARIAWAQETSPLDALRAARLRHPEALELRAAEAELLLRAGQVPRARDVLGEVRALPPSPSRWCDPLALAATLDGALERDPKLGPAGVSLTKLLAAPPAWRAGIATWLLSESEFLLERLRLREDPRFRPFREFPPADPGSIRAALRWRLEAASALDAPASKAALLRLQLLLPPKERAKTAPPAPLGDPGGWNLLGAAEACLAQQDPANAIALLATLGPAPPGEVNRAGEHALRQREQQHWLRGRALLAQAPPEDPQAKRRAALAEFEAADRLAESRHVEIGEDLDALRGLLGEANPGWKKHRRLLTGSKAKQAAALLSKRRSQRRESGPTPDDVAEILSLDPVSPQTRYYEARLLLNRNWDWESLKRTQTRIRAHPPVRTDFVRLVQQALRPSQEESLFLRHGLIKKLQDNLPPGFLEGQAFVLGLRAEIEGELREEELRPRLEVHDRALASNPGAWELRLARALLYVRLGHYCAARADLDLVELSWPSVGGVAYFRSLLLAAEGADLEAVLAQLMEARIRGYKLWTHPSWTLDHYPELARFRGQEPFDAFMDLHRKKKR